MSINLKYDVVSIFKSILYLVGAIYILSSSVRYVLLDGPINLLCFIMATYCIYKSGSSIISVEIEGDDEEF